MRHLKDATFLGPVCDSGRRTNNDYLCKFHRIIILWNKNGATIKMWTKVKFVNENCT
jgi:hypothetical protein